MIESLSELELKTIAVVDDDPENAKALGVNLETCGSKPLLFTNNFSDINRLVQEVIELADGALCDHRLSFRTPASFTGAEAVAILYGMKFPAILVSEFIDLDFNTTIRLCRKSIPVIIPRSLISRNAIIEGFSICHREIHNELPTFRKPRRSIVRIIDLGNDSGMDYVDAFVPQWNPLKAVRFPRSLLGEFDRDDLAPDTLFIAEVNIGARSTDELFFDNFELAPEPDDDDGLA